MSFLENDGYCAVCEAPAHFVSMHSWLRDHYRCQTCDSIPRERALFTIINDYFPNWRSLDVHEASPGLPSSRKLSTECKSYVGSHLYADVPYGKMFQGFRCENLESQTFEDGCFDLVISQDVMEHVLDLDAAYREIERTLKPGGAHVFTTPVYPELETSEVRARKNGEEIELLAEAEYHGNPIDPKGSLVTVHYGRDLAELIDAAAGTDTRIHKIWDKRCGLLGEFLDVIVSRKPA